MKTKKIREDFPILQRKINGQPLVYLDNSSTSQKPYQVIAAMSDFYSSYNSNIHRGIHTLSESATEAYEKVRDQTKKFIGARFREEIIFTSGTTAGINLIAGSFGEKFLRRGDEIILSEMEHHSNIVPWQILARNKGLRIKYIPLTANYRLDFKTYKKLLSRKTKLVAITHASNVLGTVNPIEQAIKLAHKAGAKVSIDAAQSVPHLPINVKKLNCDFLVFSGHKMLGPTGVGVLYGKKELLEKMPPFLSGGNMIERVTKTAASFAPLPEKFEAGTSPIAEVIGLGAAIDYLQKIDFRHISKQEKKLTDYALIKLKNISGLRLLGPTTTRDRLAIFSFVLEGVPAHDLATLFDERGIAVRSGHHCTQILHQSLNLAASTRASLYFYSTTEEIDKLVKTLGEIKKIFKT